MGEQPHSRACGWRQHPHGTACHANCPTCHGLATLARLAGVGEPTDEELAAIEAEGLDP